MSTRAALLVGGSSLANHALIEALDRPADVLATWAAEGTAAGAARLHVPDPGGAATAIGELRPEVVVIDLATSAPGPAVDEDAEVALTTTVRAVVDASVAAGCRLVLLSSDEVFAAAHGPHREDHEPDPRTPLGRVQLAAERAVLDAPGGLVVRTSEVFGWDRQADNLAMAVWRSLTGSIALAAADDVWVTPTLADDLAVAVARLVEAGADGVFHVAGADRATPHQLASAVAEAMRLDPALVVPESDPVRREARGGLLSAKLTAATDHVPLPLAESVRRFRRDSRERLSRVIGVQTGSEEAQQLREEILDKVRRYHELAHQRGPFEPHRSRVQYAGRVYGPEEMVALVDASLDFWLTLGPHGEQFERAMRDYFDTNDFVLVGSGSMANLTAMMTLTSNMFDRALQPGDEVITPAVTFPTTLTPIVHAGLVPVFVDCEIGTYNIDASRIEAAVSERTRALVVPHTLGNPCDMDTIVDVARRHDLLLMEDSCDALGSTFDDRLVGTFGELATLSFYPAHHMTMGEGGGVILNRPRLGRIARSVRDWGRDCWCASGESNTCGKRFDWQLGDLPHGYDHKYIYATLGYNFKPTDLQAAIGTVQLGRVDDFVRRRRANFDVLYEGLRKHEDALVLPTWHPKAKPSWFGLPLTVRDGLDRDDLVRWLEAQNIETRQVFAGNILRQPAFQDIHCRTTDDLANSDRVMRDTFFIGVYPGLTEPMVEFMLEQFDRFFSGRRA